MEDGGADLEVVEREVVRDALHEGLKLLALRLHVLEEGNNLQAQERLLEERVLLGLLTLFELLE